MNIKDRPWPTKTKSFTRAIRVETVCPLGPERWGVRCWSSRHLIATVSGTRAGKAVPGRGKQPERSPAHGSAGAASPPARGERWEGAGPRQEKDIWRPCDAPPPATASTRPERSWSGRGSNWASAAPGRAPAAARERPHLRGRGCSVTGPSGAASRPSRPGPASLTGASLRSGPAGRAVQHRPPLAEPHRLRHRAPSAPAASIRRGMRGGGGGTAAALPSGAGSEREAGIGALRCLAFRWGRPSRRCAGAAPAPRSPRPTRVRDPAAPPAAMRGRLPLQHVAVAVALGVASGLYIYGPLFQPPPAPHGPAGPSAPTPHSAPEKRPWGSRSRLAARPSHGPVRRGRWSRSEPALPSPAGAAPPEPPLQPGPAGAACLCASYRTLGLECWIMYDILNVWKCISRLNLNNVRKLEKESCCCVVTLHGCSWIALDLILQVINTVFLSFSRFQFLICQLSWESSCANGWERDCTLFWHP